MFCRKCGAEVDASNKFCNKCGTPIKKVEQSKDASNITEAKENKSNQHQKESATPVNNVKIPKPLIFAAAGVVMLAIVAVVIVLVVTNNSGDNKTNTEATENVNNATVNNNTQTNTPKKESSNKWEPLSLDYVPADASTEIAKSIDRSINIIGSPYYAEDYFSDEEEYATVIACMYSYEHLDKAGQKKVENFDKLVSLYENLREKFRNRPASTVERNYGLNINSFTKSVKVNKELIQKGETTLNGFKLEEKEHWFSDTTYEWVADYDKTNDVYKYTFDVSLELANPENGQVCDGYAWIYRTINGMEDSVCKIVFDKSTSASGSFSIKSEKNYTADDFDKIFLFSFGHLSTISNKKTEDVAGYNHQLLDGMEFKSIRDLKGSDYTTLIGQGVKWPNNIMYLYPGYDWVATESPMIYVEGATPEG